MLNKYVQKVHANKGFQPAQKAKKKKKKTCLAISRESSAHISSLKQLLVVFAKASWQAMALFKSLNLSIKLLLIVDILCSSLRCVVLFSYKKPFRTP